MLLLAATKCLPKMWDLKNFMLFEWFVIVVTKLKIQNTFFSGFVCAYFENLQFLEIKLSIQLFESTGLLSPHSLPSPPKSADDVTCYDYLYTPLTEDWFCNAGIFPTTPFPWKSEVKQGNTFPSYMMNSTFEIYDQQSESFWFLFSMLSTQASWSPSQMF